MACAGIDFGNKRSVVAIARRGGIDICCNEVSNRATPSMVSFGSEERHLGEPAANFAAQLHKSTVGGIQRLLGVSADTPFATAEAARLTCPVVPHPRGGGAAVQIRYEAGEDPSVEQPVVFSYQAISAMLFSKLMETASNEYKSPVSDCVISVPGYYSESQRRAILDAATIANINVLRIINEHAAIALSYGIFRTKELPDTEPIKVAFVDMGEASSSVTIAAFTKTRCDILATAFDANLGGRNIDDLIVNKFAAEWKTQKGIDALSKPRPKLRIYKECEKLKRMLSANSEAYINIECLMNDIDVKGKMVRSDLEELAAPLLDRLRDVCRKAIKDAGLEKDETLFAVEIVGAGTRVPSVKAVIEEMFKPLGAPLRTTLNMDECIARGCALMSAMLSPAFKVRDYKVGDVTPFALKAEKAFVKGETFETMQLVDKYNSLPCVKAMSFNPRGKLTLNVKYSDISALTQGNAAELLCSYAIDAPEDTEGKIKTKIRLSADGICDIIGVTHNKQVEEEEEVKVKVEKKPKPAEPAATDTPMKDAPVPNGSSNSPVNGDSTGEAKPVDKPEDKANADGPVPMETETKIEKRMVKKLKSVSVPFTLLQGPGATLAEEDVKQATEKEAKMKANDRYLKERSEAMNALEAYVYDLRSRVGDDGDLASYGPADVRAQLKTDLDATENWIYSEEGDEANKSLFVTKKSELVTKATPLLSRKKEYEERPVHINLLNATIESYKKLAVPDLEEYAHIPQEEKEKVLKCVEEAALWLKGQIAKQAGLAKDVDPVLKCSDIQAKRETVDKICRPIEKTPKPEPKVEKPEVQEPAPTAEPAKEGAPKEAGDSTTKEAPVADTAVEAAEGDKMEVDTEVPNK